MLSTPCPACDSYRDTGVLGVHTVECRFQHFMAYSGPDLMMMDRVEALRLAYEHGARREHP